MWPSLTISTKRLIRIGVVCSAILLVVYFLYIHFFRPRQLLAAIGQADRIVVRRSGDGSIIYSSVNPKDISELEQSIVVSEPEPQKCAPCLCFDAVSIELWRKWWNIGTIVLYQGGHIGFSGWHCPDTHLEDQDKLVRWLGKRGIKNPFLP
jgi:hypothetical protein